VVERLGRPLLHDAVAQDAVFGHDLCEAMTLLRPLRPLRDRHLGELRREVREASAASDGERARHLRDAVEQVRDTLDQGGPRQVARAW
jgi:hypothetical protein